MRRTRGRWEGGGSGGVQSTAHGAETHAHSETGRRRRGGGQRRCWAVLRRGSSRALSNASAEGRLARWTALVLCPAASATRRPARRAWPCRPSACRARAGGLGSGYAPAARQAQRGVRLCIRQRSGGHRGRAAQPAEASAWGRRPPRRQAAIVCESLWSVGALPPWMAVMERACPSTQDGTACFGTQVGARHESQGQIHSTATTSPSRSGATAWRQGAGAACRWHVEACPV